MLFLHRWVSMIIIGWLMVMPSSSSAVDQVEVRIIANYDDRQCRGDIPPSSNTIQKSRGIIRLTGWVRYTNTSPAIEPVTYLYEWARTTEDQDRQVLTNYNVEKHLTYERNLNRQLACYWVSKRVFASHAGEYDLTIYVRRDGELHTVGYEKVKVERIP